MAQYPASGAFFPNDRKQNPNQPDYTGNLTLEHEVVHDLMKQIEEGVEHPKLDLAGWKKVSKAGRTFLSVRGNKMRDRQDGQASAQNGYSKSYQTPVEDDEIPF